MKNNKLTIQQAKQIDMVGFLASLGIQPIKIIRLDHWYICPFHGERTASFKVNAKRNQWYHFGIGKGGDLIDFGTRYYHCTISEFLQMISGDNLPVYAPVSASALETEKLIIVTRTQPLSAPALLSYLLQRKIPLFIAKQYCVEINYTLYDRMYYGIGFANNSGGYEIRNARVKLSSSPKDITTILAGHQTAAMFEGFMDFQSYLTLKMKPADYFILNSTAFFSKALPLMQAYDEKLLFLDNDSTGDRCTAEAIAFDPGFIDCRKLYHEHEDLNDWLMTCPDTRSSF